VRATLESLKTELAAIAAAVDAIGSTDPFNIAHGNWSFSGLTRTDLARMATTCVELIEVFGGNVPSKDDALLTDYVRRLNFLRMQTIPQIWGGNNALAVQAYLSTLRGVEQALRQTFSLDKPPSKDDHLNAVLELQSLQRSIRAIESRVNQLNARSSSLDAQISVVERAHQAAEQLPTDLETLAETRAELAKLLREGKADRDDMTKVLTALKDADAKVQKSSTDAAAVLDRCEQAYRATTSQGLASAFAERSLGLAKSMWVWVGGLVVALAVGAYFGSNQLHNVAALLKEDPNRSGQAVELWINLLLAIFSVAAPVWFAWLSTKQIGQRFRLAEDYGYKSSISKAYEGYRREAAMLDPEFQARLFSSALTRLDELPLRLVETDSHGSPWHELFASEAVQKAMKSVPGFAETVKSLAESALDRFRPVGGTAVASAAAAAPAANESKAA
jgi:hypothetical protein